MKALSIVAPNGTNIAKGIKTLEVRRWVPELQPSEDLLIVENSRFLRKDGEQDQDGKAVAIVKIANIRSFEPSDIEAACASYFEEGWLVWELRDIRPIGRETPVLAARGIYEIPWISL